MSAELHVMFDLETMGMAPNGAIASIGAVRFDPYGDEISDPFYVVVDLKDQEKLGRVFNGDTILWWFQQEEAARKELVREDRIPLFDALAQFSRWVGEKSVPTWAYPATFDHVILQSAYDAMCLRNPVHWREQFCMRGLARLAPDVDRGASFVGTAHNALDDATHQAKWLQSILKAKWAA